MMWSGIGLDPVSGPDHSRGHEREKGERIRRDIRGGSLLVLLEMKLRDLLRGGS